jgi:hypothetical protein
MKHIKTSSRPATADGIHHIDLKLRLKLCEWGQIAGIKTWMDLCPPTEDEEVVE